jgi:hypothetical protein
MIRRLMSLAPIALASISLLTSAAYRRDVKLPPTMDVTAYDTGTAGFNIAVGVGKMMKDKYGTDVRVLPAGNDVARLAPLRAKRAAMSAMGSGTYFAQEGVFEFGTKEWGPQPLQLVLSSVDCNAGSLGVAKDTGVTEIKQLKGKRVGFVVGSPALNQNALAIWPSAISSRATSRSSSSRATARCGRAWSTTTSMPPSPPPSPARPRNSRPRRAASSGRRCRQRQGRLGAREEGRLVLLPAQCDLRRGHFQGQADRARQLPLPDLRAYGSLPADEVYPSPRR